jgi:hypothetical protein
LGLSSSSELEESLLEKSRSLRAAHVRDIIFWNFFYALPFVLVRGLYTGVPGLQGTDTLNLTSDHSQPSRPVFSTVL